MDAPHAVLKWDRGALEAECDRASVVRSGVEAYLGRTVFTDDGEVVVRVTLSRVRERGTVRVVATISQEDASGQASGERSVSGEATCASLDEPLTLVVALLVDAPARPSPEDEPAAADEPLPPPPTPERPVSEPEMAEPEEIQTAPSLERSAPSPGHVALLGTALISLGALPTTAGGGGLFATVKPRGFWGLGVQLAALAPQRKQLGAGELRTSLVVVGGSICPLQGVDGSVWWSACAAFSYGRLKVASEGLLDAQSKTEWLALPGFGARAAWLPGRTFMIGGGLEGAFPFSPDRYLYRDATGSEHVAFEANQLIVAASLGVGVLID